MVIPSVPFNDCLTGRPKPARQAMCVRLDAARIAVPLGAEAGHDKS
jgi:hypothetical protein